VALLFVPLAKCSGNLAAIRWRPPADIFLDSQLEKRSGLRCRTVKGSSLRWRYSQSFFLPSFSHAWPIF